MPIYRVSCILMILASLTCCRASAEKKVYPDRWVYVSRGMGRDESVSQIREIVRIASEHGLNGMVLAAGLDRLSLSSPDHLRRLQEVKRLCQNKMEIIPIIFSVGYGSAVLAHNLNLSAGQPVKDALFVVRGNEAHLVPDPPVRIVNGGFEEFKGDQFKGYDLQDEPGQISFVDHEAVKEGTTSLRLEYFGEIDPEHGNARIMQKITVHSYRYYRITCWVKTSGLIPQDAFRILVLANGHSLVRYDPQVPQTTDWRKVTVVFNSLGNEQVRLYIGLWEGKTGQVWLDDLRIEEIGLVNVLRRPGTPVTVSSDDRNTIYREGIDYKRIADPNLHPWKPGEHSGPPIQILPGSQICDGQRIRVSFYHSVAVGRDQASVCMSEQELYDIWRKEARLLHEQLQPQKYFLNMDEVRAGGSCAVCKARNISMAEILGDCITKQVAILREINPKAEIYIWSDMLDPNHNAHKNYYLVDGDLTGSWKYIPKDLIIVCWNYRKRGESLKFFSDLGFRMMAGAYYDGDTLDNPKGWLESLDHTPGAQGIIYTTWQNKYRLLADFGDLITKRNSKIN